MGKDTAAMNVGMPAEQELTLINRYARRELTAEEVYVFSVVLCDNEIDRDWERFSISALEKLADLFVGKTGVFDHSMKGKDQTARVYSAWVQRDTGRMTQAGEPYTALKARAYMPRTQKNRDLIEEIETGIKKEVSVGCAIGRVACSVCGADWKKEGCEHRKGRAYGGEICHGILQEPQDAYEWSFVAVPAQRKAGVVKTFQRKGETAGMEDFICKLKKNGIASQEDREALCGYIQSLQKQAKAGEAYRAALEGDVIRLSAFVLPGLDEEIASGILKKLELEELQGIKKALEKQRARRLPPVLQLGEEKKQTQPDHAAFRI